MESSATSILEYLPAPSEYNLKLDDKGAPFLQTSDLADIGDVVHLNKCLYEFDSSRIKVGHRSIATLCVLASANCWGLTDCTKQIGARY